MEEYGERQALLTADINVENSLRYRLPNREEDSRSDDSCQSDEWWSDSSSCSSCDSDVCSVADWQYEVNALGELMYVESLVTEIDNSDKNKSGIQLQEQKSNQGKTKKSNTQNKFIRLIRRRSSGTRHSTRRKLLEAKDKTTVAISAPLGTTLATSSNADGNVFSDDINSNNQQSSTAHTYDWQESEVQTVQLRVIGENLGRRATLSESLLGLVITALPDELNLMIAGVIPNTEAYKHQNIRTGDWLYSINGHIVNVNNIDTILKTIVPPVEVALGLRTISSSRISNTNPTNQSQVVHPQSELVRSFLSSNSMYKFVETNEPPLLSVMYLTREGMSADDEDVSPDQGIIYSFPSSPDLNILHKIRGAFITLLCLMQDAILAQQSPSQTLSTSMYFNGKLLHVVYCSEGEELLLLSVPHEKCILSDAQRLTEDIVRCLKFKYQTLSRCFKFKEHIPLLEQLFSIVFSHLYSPTATSTATSDVITRFEQLFPVAHWIPLPRDAQMQIDDALSELEANDFGSYVNNNNHGCQRLYSVIGTCLYHKGYLLSSHLARQDLIDVNSWCRQRGLLNLTRLEYLSNLVAWHEVYPESCNRGLRSTTSTSTVGNFPVSSASNAFSNSATVPFPPNARWFLLVIGQGNTLLVTLLEAGGCSVEAVGVTGPDIYYVHQAQATLSHINKIGVPALADKWLISCVRPQVISPDCDFYSKTSPKRSSTDNSNNVSQQSKETSKSCENLQQAKLNFSQISSGSNSKLTSASSLTSTMKHRNSPDNSISLISVSHQSTLLRNACQDEISEESTRSSIISDEVAPILGRRAQRERERERAAAASDTNSHSRLSDSDFSDDSDWEPRRTLYGSRSLDMLLDLNKTRVSDNSNSIIPSSLLAGKQNSLFHYIQLDQLEGIMLSSLFGGGDRKENEQQPLTQIILEKFRSTAQSIHSLLQNTVQFKKLNTNEVHESLINKSLVAIKEYGMLFEVELEHNKKSSPTSLSFWVVGRLFFIPHAKEVYVCYEESAPQNMVEIAFRLALSASG